MIEINLLPRTTILSRTQRKIQNAVVWGFGVASAIVLLIVVSTLAVEGFLTLKLSQIQSDQDRLTSSLADFADKAGTLRALKYKLVGIEAIKGAKSNFAQRLTTVQNLLVPGLTVTGLTAETDGTLAVTVKADNISQLSPFLTNLEGAAGGLPLSQVVLTGLRLEPAGGYTVTVKAKYGHKS